MALMNNNYNKLRSSYLFSDIAKKVQAFQESHPDLAIIRLGIGDVTRALPQSCIRALHAAVDEMADDATFRGYGPEQGYDFLRKAIADHDFKARGCPVEADEIFVSDGAKCDTGNFQELFATEIRVALPDPVYPVYLDTNVMAGRTGEFRDARYEGILYLDGTRENGFVPEVPDAHADLIYLCYPNNPTGATATKAQLAEWVAYAKREKAILLFDAAYEAFITNPELPHSIYEIPGAEDVAVEFRSLSKTAGFTGLRCAFTVVPKACKVYDDKGNAHSLHAMWNRRHTTKFNGVSYPVQKAAAAIFGEEGKKETEALIRGYLENAAAIRKGMTDLGFYCIGGDNSPYIWIDGKSDSWSFFDRLLAAGVVCTPGAGFGKCGEGYIRISAFNSRKNVDTAMERIRKALA